MINNNILYLCLILIVSGTFAFKIAPDQQCVVKPEHQQKGFGCLPQYSHTELGHAYQKNFNSSVANNTDFQSLDQFALTYFTEDKCTYYQDLQVNVIYNDSYVKQVMYENFTSAFQNKTVNIVKYSPYPDGNQPDYLFYSQYFDCKSSKIILPKLFEEKGESYNVCLFNEVKYLNNSIDCNLAHLFHYSSEQLFGFFNTSSFQDFIYDHAVHVISNLKEVDADFSPFGSKQWYFTFNFMLQMTLDVKEYESLNQTLKFFNTAVPKAQLNRQIRPWFVGIASYSPYELDLNGGIILNEALYGSLYDNIKSNQFDILISSHPDLQQAKVFISKDYRNFSQVNDTNSLTALSQFEAFVLIYIPSQLETPAILNTSFDSLRINLEGKEIINISAAKQQTGIQKDIY
ncbi:hypothetical protein TTHERM_00425840 (macronuclear) [Tetrahymena thermophila SB210]|uniref:Transmembrane protein n=1 Tax=Tetrahymena thermophila (strain SB210) TaxID=312017 RepID=Q23AH5_TETTS|nr:hypothetical protein TTHERM_00425840 [Tetrahymena thermophila SB210]EAR93517.1 hypothetical protein TTHERM_00425840 [Tetrahymena thermophila SB210]|eukprot:XP_001013762.1 hypothetical protein TTHERM_00425840 [Tetrahymena thermophila SB210]